MNINIKYILRVFAVLLAAVVAIPAQGAFVPAKNLFVSLQDSISTTDSVPSKREKGADAVEDPVYYESSDSMVWSRTGNAHLYGNCEVRYQKVQLNAAVITMNMDSSEVRAHGVTDSTGVVSGIPVFRDGDTPYETDRIKYNFKSQRGFINNVFTAQGDGFMTGEKAKIHHL